MADALMVGLWRQELSTGQLQLVRLMMNPGESEVEHGCYIV